MVPRSREPQGNETRATNLGQIPGASMVRELMIIIKTSRVHPFPKINKMPACDEDNHAIFPCHFYVIVDMMGKKKGSSM